MRASICLVLGISASCGDGGERSLVMVPADPNALLTLVQDGDGAWQPATADPDGTIRVAVGSERFGHARACWQRQPATGEIAVGLEVHLMTLDAMALPPPCAPARPTRLDGRVTQGVTTRVFAGARRVTAKDGAYALEIDAPGVRDVAALVQDPVGARILIERGVDLGVDRTLDLDVARRGVALLPATLVVTGADDVLTYGAAYLAGGTALRLNLGDPQEPRRALVVPSQLLVAGDRLVVGAVAHDATTGVYRTGQRALGIEDARWAIAVGVPGPAELVVVDGRARWTGVWDEVTVEAWSPAGADGGAVRIVASAAWLADGATELGVPDPATLPGWDPSWGRFTRDQPLMWRVTAASGEPDGDLAQVRRTSDLTW